MWKCLAKEEMGSQGCVTHNPLRLSVFQLATVESQKALWTARWSGRTSDTATPSCTSVCPAFGSSARLFASVSKITSGRGNFPSAFVSRTHKHTLNTSKRTWILDSERCSKMRRPEFFLIPADAHLNVSARAAACVSCSRLFGGSDVLR